VPGHPLLDANCFDGDIETYLASIGQIFVAHRGHDSHNTSFGVRVDGRPWFVKYTRHPEALTYLESALRFYAAVQHWAIVPLVNSVRGDDGMAIVHEWVDGEVLSDMHPHGVPREHPDSAYSRFRALPTDEIVGAIDTIIAAHLAVTNRGFVAVDFYDGAVMYDFDRRRVNLCDLDAYCPGSVHTGSRPAVWLDPLHGSRGVPARRAHRRAHDCLHSRPHRVHLSERGLTGEPERHRWRGSAAMYDVAWRATRQDPEQRYPSVAAFAGAWRSAAAQLASGNPCHPA